MVLFSKQRLGCLDTTFVEQNGRKSSVELLPVGFELQPFPCIQSVNTLLSVPSSGLFFSEIANDNSPVVFLHGAFFVCQSLLGKCESVVSEHVESEVFMASFLLYQLFPVVSLTLPKTELCLARSTRWGLRLCTAAMKATTSRRVPRPPQSVWTPACGATAMSPLSVSVSQGAMVAGGRSWGCS